MNETVNEKNARENREFKNEIARLKRVILAMRNTIQMLQGVVTLRDSQYSTLMAQYNEATRPRAKGDRKSAEHSKGKWLYDQVQARKLEHKSDPNMTGRFVAKNAVKNATAFKILLTTTRDVDLTNPENVQWFFSEIEKQFSVDYEAYKKEVKRRKSGTK